MNIWRTNQGFLSTLPAETLQDFSPETHSSRARAGTERPGDKWASWESWTSGTRQHWGGGGGASVQLNPRERATGRPGLGHGWSTSGHGSEAKAQRRLSSPWPGKEESQEGPGGGPGGESGQCDRELFVRPREESRLHSRQMGTPGRFRAGEGRDEPWPTLLGWESCLSPTFAQPGRCLGPSGLGHS